MVVNLEVFQGSVVYGNKGFVADGADNIAYSINSNFAYIGPRKDVTNDNILTIPS